MRLALVVEYQYQSYMVRFFIKSASALVVAMWATNAIGQSNNDLQSQGRIPANPGFINAVSDAVFVGINASIYSDNIEQGRPVLSYDQSRAVAQILLQGSTISKYSYNKKDYYLLYNPSSDLFISAKSVDGLKYDAGLLPGRSVSEDLYKMEESKSYFENMLGGRPAVVERIEQDFLKSTHVPDVFIKKYKYDRDTALLVQKNLEAFIKLSKRTLTESCFSTLKTLKPAQIGLSYSDKPIFTISFSTDAENVFAFRSKDNPRLGGYVMLTKKDNDCSVSKVIMNNFVAPF
ncbi:hypothetical protein [Rhizobium subbaraonis]|nr:hypothetical protein [Rhizobium subbaraonis]